MTFWFQWNFVILLSISIYLMDKKKFGPLSPGFQWSKVIRSYTVFNDKDYWIGYNVFTQCAYYVEFVSITIAWKVCACLVYVNDGSPNKTARMCKLSFINRFTFFKNYHSLVSCFIFIITCWTRAGVTSTLCLCLKGLIISSKLFHVWAHMFPGEERDNYTLCTLMLNTLILYIVIHKLSHDMRFPTMWYVLVWYAQSDQNLC